MNIIIIVITAKRAYKSLRPANGRQSLLNFNLLIKPSYNKAGCDNNSDVKLNNIESDKDNKELRLIK